MVEVRTKNTGTKEKNQALRVKSMVLQFKKKKSSKPDPSKRKRKKFSDAGTKNIHVPG